MYGGIQRMEQIVQGHSIGKSLIFDIIKRRVQPEPRVTYVGRITTFRRGSYSWSESPSKIGIDYLVGCLY